MCFRSVILSLFIFISFQFPVHGQNGTSEKNPFARVDSTTTVPKKSAGYLRHHERLHSGYSGYFIELKNSPVPLPRNDTLLLKYGLIHYDQLEDGTYSYGLKADFDRRDSFEKYAREVVIPKGGNVILYKYRYGKRKVMRLRK